MFHIQDKKEALIELIREESLSALALLSKRLLLDEEEIRNLIEVLMSEGAISGRLTEDGKRFFRSDLPTSEEQHSPLDDELPEYTKFSSYPGRMVVGWSFVILILSAVGILLAPNNEIESFFYLLTFFGVILLIIGCYTFGTKKTIQ